MQKKAAPPLSLSTMSTQLNSSIENVEPPKKRRCRQVKKDVGKSRVKAVGECSVNVDKGCVSDSKLGETNPGHESSPNAVTKTN